MVVMECQEKPALVKGAVTMTQFQKAYHIATTSAIIFEKVTQEKKSLWRCKRALPFA